MIRSRWVAVVLAMLAIVGLAASGLAADDAGTIKLFNGKNFDGWKRFLDPKKPADPDKIWTIKDGIIVCEGSVNGYLITDKEYENYVLRVQWRWGEKVTAKRRNSGVFVHVVGPDKIWPKSIEAQLMADNAGDIWLVDGFKLHVDSARQDPKQARHFFRTIKAGVEKPLGEWNQYEITCKGDTVKLVVNGQLVNEGTKAELTKGKILLQSEGAEIHFRNIELTPLK